MRTVNPIDSLRQDLKYGVRQLRMKPGFALAAVVSLALGIGANTAFFTMADQILLRLLPVHNPRELVQLREQVRRVDPNLVVSDMRTLNDQLNMRLANERMLSFLSVGFALLATLLAVVGLHGVLSFVVARRTREIGIRMALGAERGHVIRLVLREMLLVIVFGIAAGVATGLLCGRFVESQLFGVKAADPPIFALSVAAVLTASLGAAFMPSWRASRLDPTRALRHE